MLSYDTLVSQITALPTPVLTATLNRFGGSVGGSKQAAARWLADRIYSGAIAVADVLPATPAAPAPKQDTAAVAAAAAVAGRAESIALDAVAAIKTVKDSVTNVAAMVNTLSDKLAAQTPAVERDEINAAVTRAIADAFAPFKTAVEQAGAQTAVADLSAVHVVRTCPAVDVFGIDVLDMTGAPMIVEVWNHPQAPAVDPDFIWTEPILRHLLLSQQTGENLWFGGDKGTGKSETARQFAARTSVILLDEITNADPGELAPLNGFLEPKACVSFGGQPHVRAPGVLCFAADNTFGSGDDSGRYAGTRNQNSALVDRFARVIAFKFLPADQEIKALSQHTGCSPALARHVHAAIVVARSKVTTAEITDAPSIRSAMAFIRALRVLPPDDAWEAAVVARQPSECHAVLRGIFETCLSRETIAKNL
jgi:MoxR-like ATPase